MANTIVLKGMSGRLIEGVAAGAITPGHLVKVNSSGTYVVHATEAGNAEKLFAVEDALQGRTIDNAYASTERVSMHAAVPGDEIQAWILDGQVIAIGDLLVSKGDGTLRKWADVATTVTPEVPVAVAVAALSPSGANGRCAVRVL